MKVAILVLALVALTASVAYAAPSNNENAEIERFEALLEKILQKEMVEQQSELRDDMDLANEQVDEPSGPDPPQQDEDVEIESSKIDTLIQKLLKKKSAKEEHFNDENMAQEQDFDEEASEEENFDEDLADEQDENMTQEQDFDEEASEEHFDEQDENMAQEQDFDEQAEEEENFDEDLADEQDENMAQEQDFDEEASEQYAEDEQSGPDPSEEAEIESDKEIEAIIEEINRRLTKQQELDAKQLDEDIARSQRLENAALEGTLDDLAQEQDEGKSVAEIENEKITALFEKLAQKLDEKEKELEEKMEALAQEQDLQEDVGTEQEEAMEQDHDENEQAFEADKKEMAFSEAEEDDDAALQELIDQMRESLDNK
ncbi:Golgi integral membrane protein 4-like [Halichondria panicea]|uniref:Golgi integral membrane protein 4-like n=1 Tax=Halichondria panicea TaxID=6063 RepID=UPI00312B8314